jgi:hypothetical protein
MPSANDFTFPHRDDFFGTSASFVSLLEVSLDMENCELPQNPTHKWYK